MLRRITATNIFHTEGTASYQFGILSFLSPPTTSPSDTVSITSYSGGNKIDACTASISGLTVRTFSSFTITDINGLALTVNQQEALKLTFTLVDTLSGSDYFTVQFPSGTTFSFDSSTVTGTPAAVVKTSATYNPITRLATIYMSDPSKTYFSGSTVSLTLGYYTAPTSILPTEGIVATIYRAASKAKMTGTASIVAQESVLTGSLTVTNKTINANTAYLF